MTELRVVDGDGHIMEEPNDIWTPDRIDHDRWGDWVPHKVVEDEIYETTFVGGAVRGGGRELHDQMAAAVGMTPREFYDLLEGLRRPGGHDPIARLADLDADGIDAAVCTRAWRCSSGRSTRSWHCATPSSSLTVCART